MKIGILGNMNNVSFTLARYLRDMGYDCEVLIFKNEPQHFHPSSDTTGRDFETFCHVVEWGDPADFLKQDFAQVKKDLEPYAFLIGHGPAPACVAKAGRYLDLFMPYGYDLYSLPFFRMVHPLRLPAYLMVRHFQRKGIRNSTHILFDKSNASFEQIFDKLKLHGKRIVSPQPMIYSREYDVSDQPADEWSAQLKTWRSENDLLIVQHIRQIWKKSPDRWSFKGNDHLIRGYTRFVGEHPQLRTRLLLFEYGNDVDESKQLIDELGIKDRITWLPKMSRKKLMQVLQVSDLVIGELHHSWLTYGVVMEALCLGKPFMHRRNDAEYRDVYPELYPNFYADSEETVRTVLNQVLEQKSELPAIGMKGRKWFDRYCVELPLQIITDLIKKKQVALSR